LLFAAIFCLFSIHSRINGRIYPIVDARLGDVGASLKELVKAYLLSTLTNRQETPSSKLPLVARGPEARSMRIKVPFRCPLSCEEKFA
jgi:hypothetical protein